MKLSAFQQRLASEAAKLAAKHPYGSFVVTNQGLTRVYGVYDRERDAQYNRKGEQRIFRLLSHGGRPTLVPKDA